MIDVLQCSRSMPPAHATPSVGPLLCINPRPSVRLRHHGLFDNRMCAGRTERVTQTPVVRKLK